MRLHTTKSKCKYEWERFQYDAQTVISVLIHSVLYPMLSNWLHYEHLEIPLEVHTHSFFIQNATPYLSLCVCLFCPVLFHSVLKGKPPTKKAKVLQKQPLMAKLAVYAQYQANQQSSVKKAGMFLKK